MTSKSKRIFLAICIIVPFAVYCFYYYKTTYFNKVGYRFSDFEYIEMTFGTRDSVFNSFNSKAGEYRFINSKGERDTLKVNMRKDDLHYLDFVANKFGFWNVPDDMTTSSNDPRVKRYTLKYVYKTRTKEVIFDEDYGYTEDAKANLKNSLKFEDIPKIREAVQGTIKEIEQMIADVERR